MFNTVNESLKWSAKQVKSACPWRQKKGDEPKLPDEDIRSDAADEERQPRDSARVDGDDDDTSKRREQLKKHEQLDKSGTDKSKEYAAPSQICPPSEPPCCFIKMQNPCAPCCCDNKPPPCPSSHSFRLDPPREPTCGCDLCKKGYPNDRCCDHREAFRRATTGPRFFENA